MFQPFNKNKSNIILGPAQGTAPARGSNIASSFTYKEAHRWTVADFLNFIHFWKINKKIISSICFLCIFVWKDQRIFLIYVVIKEWFVLNKHNEKH